MTLIRVAPPDIEEDITAEQVTAYLLAPERGWRQLSEEDSPGWSSFMSRVGRRFVGWSNENTSPREIEEAIHDIARAEGRHPSAVLADIVGPAVGSGIPSRGETAECGPGLAVPIYATDIERAKCMFRARLTLQRIERERRGASRVYVETADDESAREAQKESE